MASRTPLREKSGRKAGIMQHDAKRGKMHGNRDGDAAAQLSNLKDPCSNGAPQARTHGLGHQHPGGVHPARAQGGLSLLKQDVQAKH